MKLVDFSFSFKKHRVWQVGSFWRVKFVARATENPMPNRHTHKRDQRAFGPRPRPSCDVPPFAFSRS